MHMNQLWHGRQRREIHLDAKRSRILQLFNCLDGMRKRWQHAETRDTHRAGAQEKSLRNGDADGPIPATADWNRVGRLVDAHGAHLSDLVVSFVQGVLLSVVVLVVHPTRPR